MLKTLAESPWLQEMQIKLNSFVNKARIRMFFFGANLDVEGRSVLLAIRQNCVTA